MNTSVPRSWFLRMAPFSTKETLFEMAISKAWPGKVYDVPGTTYCVRECAGHVGQLHELA